MFRARPCVAALLLLGSALAGSTAEAVDGDPQYTCGGSGGTGSLGNAKIALHALPFSTLKACAANAPTQFGCDSVSPSDLSISWPLDTPTSVYVVVLDIPPELGLKGAAFGLNYFAYNPTTSTGIFINADRPTPSQLVPET